MSQEESKKINPELFANFDPNAETTFGNIEIAIEGWKKLPEADKNNTSEQTNLVRTIMDKLPAVKNALENLYRERLKESTEEMNGSTITSAFETIQSFLTHQNNLKNIDDTIKERSDIMHAAAEKNASKKGIWKIGQNHVNDINRDHPSQSYNLVEQSAFDKLVKNYKAIKESQQNNNSTN
ncbi:MAG: hypothetical protein AB8E82_16765 [Aureispira sp.]